MGAASAAQPGRTARARISARAERPTVPQHGAARDRLVAEVVPADDQQQVVTRGDGSSPTARPEPDHALAVVASGLDIRRRAIQPGVQPERAQRAGAHHRAGRVATGDSEAGAGRRRGRGQRRGYADRGGRDKQATSSAHEPTVPKAADLPLWVTKRVADSCISLQSSAQRTARPRRAVPLLGCQPAKAGGMCRGPCWT